MTAASALLPIDLRSDTVTRPGAAMRDAIARAEVGDDLYGEDPTVNRLQEEVAALLGKEAALFVPSGTMANQIALRVNSQAGDDVLLSEGAHIKWYESGAAASLAGVQLVTIGSGGPGGPGGLAAQSGLFSAADVEAVYQPRRSDNASAPMTVLCIENTHNRGGGRVWPRAQLDEVCKAARRLDLRLHLDGARLWNAAIQQGVAPRELCQNFDTVSVCLSKGLGAPVGSLFVASRADVDRARRYRRMYGGSMRQSGVLAAAGLYALSHNYERLQLDHEHAQLIAHSLSRLTMVHIVEPVETNIVLFDLLEPAPDAATLVAALRERGVLCAPFGPRRVRLVTHLDVDRASCASAALQIQQVLCG